MKDSEKLSTVYLSGNWDGKNYMDFFTAKEELTKEEFIVLSRCDLPIYFSWEEAKNIIIEMITACYSFCLLPGWEQSREAAFEYGFALSKGKQILMMDKLREQWKEGRLYADGCACDAN